jgi:hypothetical protein
MQKVSMKQVAKLANLLHAGILLGLSFEPEDGGEIFLRNIRSFSTHYTTLYPGR